MHDFNISKNMNFNWIYEHNHMGVCLQLRKNLFNTAGYLKYCFVQTKHIFFFNLE